MSYCSSALIDRYLGLDDIESLCQQPLASFSQRVFTAFHHDQLGQVINTKGHRSLFTVAPLGQPLSL